MSFSFAGLPANPIWESEHFFVIEDGYPVSPGHLLIVAKEARVDYFALTEDEQANLAQVIIMAKDHILKSRQPDGFNIGMNCGESAGQTVMQFHCHVIPRYKGDMKNPRGGVRHCIEGKGGY